MIIKSLHRFVYYFQLLNNYGLNDKKYHILAFFSAYHGVLLVFIDHENHSNEWASNYQTLPGLQSSLYKTENN